MKKIIFILISIIVLATACKNLSAPVDPGPEATRTPTLTQIPPAQVTQTAIALETAGLSAQQTATSVAATATAGAVTAATATPTNAYILKWGQYGVDDGEFRGIRGIACDSAGNIYVSDENPNSRIQKFSSTGTFLTKWGSYGTADGQFDYPRKVVVDSSNNVYCLETGNSRVQKFSSSGTFLTKWGSYSSTPGNGEFYNVYDMAIDPGNNILVADCYASRIQKFDSSGNYITSWSAGTGVFSYGIYVTTDLSSNVYVYLEDSNKVEKYNSSGVFVTEWGEYGSDAGEFYYPKGLGRDNSGNICVLDYKVTTDTECCHARIQKFDTNGTFLSEYLISNSFTNLGDVDYFMYNNTGSLYLALYFAIFKVTP